MWDTYRAAGHKVSFHLVSFFVGFDTKGLLLSKAEISIKTRQAYMTRQEYNLGREVTPKK